jgi:hypothetical protein
MLKLDGVGGVLPAAISCQAYEERKWQVRIGEAHAPAT